MGELKWNDDDDSTVTYDSACTTCEKCDVRLRLIRNLLRYRQARKSYMRARGSCRYTFVLRVQYSCNVV